MEFLNTVLSQVVAISILIFDFIGIMVILFAGIKGVFEYIKQSPFVRLNLARGLAMGLEFKLGSEILRTVVVREFAEIFLVAGIIVLRAALTFLIHWEIKNEETSSKLNSKIKSE